MELIQSVIRRRLLLLNNSTIGHQAEKIFRENIVIKEKLKCFFQKNIHSIEKVHGKKTDNLILFEDNSFVSVQNKKIKWIGGRGLSVDRRPLEKCFSPDINTLLGKLCLDKNISNNEKFLLTRKLEKQEVETFIRKVFLGKVLSPHYFIFMQSEKLFSFNLFLLKSDVLLDFLINNINVEVKKTCLSLGKNIYLQRKGSLKNDKKYHDIQTKFIVSQEILDFCQKL